MKRVIVIIALIAGYLYSDAQVRFSGIGIFKIGTDTALLLNFANSNVDQIFSCKSFNELTSVTEKCALGNFKVLLRLKKTEPDDTENFGVT